MKGQKITEVFDFNSDYTLLKLEDGSGLLVKVVSIVSVENFKELGKLVPYTPITTTTKTETKEKPAKEKPAKGKKEEPEEEEETLTGEDLVKMDFKELSELCKDSDLDTDPDSYDEEDVDELRAEIAEELDLTLPEVPEEEEESEEEEEEEEEEDDDMTWEDLTKLDYDELGSLCEEEKLDVDPDDFDEDSEAGLRKAIAEELGIEVPKKKDKKKDKDKKKGKGKKKK